MTSFIELEFSKGIMYRILSLNLHHFVVLATFVDI